MLNFVGQVHTGVKGVVFLPDGTPAAHAEIGEIIHIQMIARGQILLFSSVITPTGTFRIVSN